MRYFFFLGVTMNHWLGCCKYKRPPFGDSEHSTTDEIPSLLDPHITKVVSNPSGIRDCYIFFSGQMTHRFHSTTRYQARGEFPVGRAFRAWAHRSRPKTIDSQMIQDESPHERGYRLSLIVYLPTGVQQD